MADSVYKQVNGWLSLVACQLAPYLLLVAPSPAQLPPHVLAVAQHAQFLHVSSNANGRAPTQNDGFSTLPTGSRTYNRLGSPRPVVALIHRCLLSFSLLSLYISLSLEYVYFSLHTLHLFSIISEPARITIMLRCK